MKLFQDKTLGPFADSVMARHRKEGMAARFEKKRVAGLMAVGGALGSEWASFGLPVMHQMFSPPGVKVRGSVSCVWVRADGVGVKGGGGGAGEAAGKECG